MQKSIRTIETLPIPAFYCCYLLRSTVYHQILYCGSTPNLLRRIRQHNGIENGGAKRTGRKNLRPWEVTCIVQGFPSKIAALQFEWAWQNTHITRHITKESRINQPKVVGTGKFSHKTGKEKSKSTRPSMSLENRLQNLHLLLRSKSFERWPLSLRFFCEDVYKVYNKHTTEKKEQLRPGIEVSLDENATKIVSRKKKDAPVESAPGEPPPNPIEKMDFGYSSLKQHLEKSKAALDASEKSLCSVCNIKIKADKSLAVVCPHTDCSATSHLHCLSAEFLRQENNSHAIVPVSGNCPSCKTHTRWDSLVRELSLRMRGQKEVEKLYKKPRGKKGNAVDAAVAVLEAEGQDGDEDAELDGEEREAERRFEEFEAEASMIDVEEPAETGRKRSRSRSLEIKDSDWDDVDVLD